MYCTARFPRAVILKFIKTRLGTSEVSCLLLFICFLHIALKSGTKITMIKSLEKMKNVQRFSSVSSHSILIDLAKKHPIDMPNKS